MGRIYETEAGGSFGPSAHGLSLADGAAFYRCQGVDLSPFAGVAGVMTPYLLKLYDSAGKLAWGWLGAASAAESLGAEKVQNGGFETAGAGGADVFASWSESAGNGTITRANDQVQSGSWSCKMTAGTTTSASVAQGVVVVPGALYKLAIPTRGDGTNAGRFSLWDNTNSKAILAITTAGAGAAAWATTTVYFTAPAGCVGLTVNLYAPPLGSSGTCWFDDVSLKRVDEPASGGVHILSSVNGSTRNWASIESGFNYNDTAYTFQVERGFLGDEALYWQDAAGADHLLGQSSAEDAFYLEWSEFDLPPVEWQSQRLPEYDGELYQGYRFSPRILNVGVLIRPGSTIAALLAQKETFLEWFSPEDGLGALKKVWLDGSSVWHCRAIAGGVVGPVGMDSAMRRAKGHGGQFGTLQIWCPYPLWYDPEQQSASVALDGSTPVTLAITNAGGYKTQPQIVIAASANAPQIQKQGVAADYINLGYNVASGYVTIYMERGNKRILTSAGADITYLASAESKFFHLPRGATTLEMSCTSGTGTVTVYWYEYYPFCP